MNALGKYIAKQEAGQPPPLPPPAKLPNEWAGKIRHLVSISCLLFLTVLFGAVGKVGMKELLKHRPWEQFRPAPAEAAWEPREAGGLIINSPWPFASGSDMLPLVDSEKARGVIREATLYRSLGAPEGYELMLASCTYEVDVTGPDCLDAGIQGGIDRMSKAIGDPNPQFTARPFGSNAKVAIYHPSNHRNAEVRMFVMTRGNEMRGVVVLYPKWRGAVADRIIESVRWID